MKKLTYCTVSLFVFVLSLTLISATKVIAQVYPEGMISYWKFDDTSGSIATDSVGTSDGEIQDIVTWSSNDYMVNGALSFNGTGNYIEVQNNPAYNNLQALSISAWIKYAEKDGCPSGEECRWSIVSKYWYELGGMTPQRSFTLFIGAPYKLGLSLSFADGDYCNRSVSDIDPGEFDYGNWYHVVGVYDQTDPDGIILYIDGERQTTTLSCNTGGNIEGPLNTTMYPLQIGRYRPDKKWFFKGIMDEVATFNRALAPEEIQQHYQNGLEGNGYELPDVPQLECVGFESPMDSGPVTVRGKKRALPMKAHLYSNGDMVTDQNISAAPVIQIIFQSGIGSQAIDVTDDALSANEETEGNQFFCTEDGKWRYNLKVDQKTWSAPGTYYLYIDTGDDTEYTIEPKCEASFVIE
jgi:hypothetical protein